MTDPRIAKPQVEPLPRSKSPVPYTYYAWTLRDPIALGFAIACLRDANEMLELLETKDV